jgi:sugar diacid utilization regulator
VEQVAEEVGAEVARLGRELLTGADEVADAMTERIRAAVSVYRSDTVVSAAELRQTCFDHVHFIFGAIGRRPDLAAHESRANGRKRARAGVPLAAVMEAYRVGASLLWDRLAAAAMAHAVSAEVLVRAAGDMWLVQDTFTHAMAEGYRDELTEQALGREQQRSALVQALLEGRLTNLWETAEALRMPSKGPYVVIAAAVPEAGRHGLPQIENLLHTSGISSAWWLGHDLQVGIASVPTPDRQLDRLADILGERSAGVPVGVSPCYDQLPETPNALRLARIALRGSTPDQPVVLFDRASLAVAAVSDPDVMGRLAHTTLAGIAGLTDRDRLLDTFGAWLDTGSANAAAQRLFCHPNTVRYRLRRLEEHTGRSLTDPRAVAELSLAFEINRRLPN